MQFKKSSSLKGVDNACRPPRVKVAKRADAKNKQQTAARSALCLAKPLWRDNSSQVDTRSHWPQRPRHKDDVTALHTSCLTMTSEAIISLVTLH